MFARKQIDEPSFLAARKYQTTYERAEAARRVSSVDLSMPPISGGHGGDFQGADMVLRATKELKQIERLLLQRSGEDGVTLLRDILGAGKTIERAAMERGENTKDRIGWWGGMFRRNLRHLAEISGFAVQGAYRNRHKQLHRERRREASHGGKDRMPASGSKEPGLAGA